jgi:hypothetical protein
LDGHVKRRLAVERFHKWLINEHGSWCCEAAPLNSVQHSSKKAGTAAKDDKEADTCCKQSYELQHHG